MNFRFSDSSALSDGNYSVSAKELLTNAKALAARLQEAKLSRIGLLAGNSLGWVTVDLACLIGDVCLVPIPTFFSKKIGLILLSLTASSLIIFFTSWEHAYLKF